jgi:Cu/Ag efflux protein CusF
MNQIILSAVIALAIIGVQPSVAAGPVIASDTVAQMMTMEGKGKIVSLLPEREQVVIDHGPIEGMMDAMVMGFTVVDPKLLDGLEVGQAVTFKLRHHDMVVTEISPDSGS